MRIASGWILFGLVTIGTPIVKTGTPKKGVHLRRLTAAHEIEGYQDELVELRIRFAVLTEDGRASKSDLNVISARIVELKELIKNKRRKSYI